AATSCPGCGGRNPPGSPECDWCGRPFVSQGRRLRITIWQVISSLLLLALIGAVAALAFLNAGRALPPARASSPTSTPPATTMPTPVVTPRLIAPATPTPAPPPTPPPPAPTPAPTATPQRPVARVANTAGQGVSVRIQPGLGAARAGVLRDGTRVVLTGNEQTVAARVWREIETEDRSLRGWVQADFLQAAQ
ncbi:MAG TPA: SH3 domain-containing protein, partial [Chloroflexota bacterium]|nr:SH3 domain-containing protein [Chloroflexota bacterium]